MERSERLAWNQAGDDSRRETLDEFEQWWAAQKYHPQGPISLWKAEFRRCFDNGWASGYIFKEQSKCNI